LLLIAVAALFLLGPTSALLSKLGQLLLSAVIGLALLWLFNLALGFVHMHVAVNPFTMLVAGIFQLPGLLLLLVMTRWFV